MGIAEDAARGDETLEKEGLKVFVEKKANLLLENATLDYTEGQGFMVTGVTEAGC